MPARPRRLLPLTAVALLVATASCTYKRLTLDPHQCVGLECAGDSGGDASGGDALPSDGHPGDNVVIDPSDGLPTDPAPGDTLPGDTLPGDTLPGDTLPGDTLPGDALPGDGGPACPADTYLDDAPGYAITNIDIAGGYGSESCLGDVDWFNVSVPYGSVYRLDVRGEVDVALVQCNSLRPVDTCVTLASPSGVSCVVSGQAGGDGQYCLGIHGRTSQPSAYAITGSSSYASCYDDTQFEQNDSEEAPRSINDTTVAVACPGDPDWYQVTSLSGQGGLNVAVVGQAALLEKLQLSTSACDGAIAPLDCTLRLGDVSSRLNCTLPARSNNTCLGVALGNPGGVMYSGSFSYSLLVGEKVDCGNNGLEAEPNDTVADATQVPLGALYNGSVCLTDVDVLRYATVGVDGLNLQLTCLGCGSRHPTLAFSDCGGFSLTLCGNGVWSTDGSGDSVYSCAMTLTATTDLCLSITSDAQLTAFDYEVIAR